MAKKKIKSYSNPWGDIGLLDAIDMEELKGAGIVAAAGVGTMILVPKGLSMIQNALPESVAKWTKWIIPGIEILGGFAAYKYGDRYIPHDAAVAAGAVMMGHGVGKIVWEISNGKIGFAGLSSDILPEEEALMAALNAVEDEPLALPDPGAPYANDETIQPSAYQGVDDEYVFDDIEVQREFQGDEFDELDIDPASSVDTLQAIF